MVPSLFCGRSELRGSEGGGRRGATSFCSGCFDKEITQLFALSILPLPPHRALPLAERGPSEERHSARSPPAEGSPKVFLAEYVSLSPSKMLVALRIKSLNPELLVWVNASH